MASSRNILSPWQNRTASQNNAATSSAKHPHAESKRATPGAHTRETKVPIPKPYQSSVTKASSAPANSNTSVGSDHPKLKAAQKQWIEKYFQGRDKMIKPSLLRDTSFSSSDGSIPATSPQELLQQRRRKRRLSSSTTSSMGSKTKRRQIQDNAMQESSDSSFEAYTSDENEIESEEPNREDGFDELSAGSDSDSATGNSAPQPVAFPEGSTIITTSDGKQLPKFDIALDGRLYNVFPIPGSDGRLTQAKGAIFPSGYQLYNDPDSPYICPVRSCRRLFPDLSNLRGHFGGKHCQEKLNDCRDGTLTVVGRYRNSSGSSAAFVTSREATSTEETPLTEPSIRMTNHQFESRPSGHNSLAQGLFMRPKPGVDAPKASPIPVQALNLQSKLPREALGVETYLLSFLRRPQRKGHDRADIAWLKGRPRRRDIPPSWVGYHQDEELDLRNYAIILAYLVGDSVDGSERCTSASHHKSYRLSNPCVTLPSAMPPELKAIFSKSKACIGCKYVSHIHRQKLTCSWTRDERPTSGDSTFQDFEQSNVGHYHEQKPVSTDSTLKHQVTMTSGTQGRLEDHLEMEDWEFSPGVVKDIDTHETVALSSAFLRSSHATEISPDVSFRVLVLHSGHSESWAVESTTLRTCSVASGKLTVKLGDQDPIKLGPHGLFVIRPGQRCRVKNMGYIDVLVHCTVVSNHALQAP